MLVIYNSNLSARRVQEFEGFVEKWKEYIQIYKSFKINKNDFKDLKSNVIYLDRNLFDFLLIDGNDLTELSKKDLVDILVNFDGLKTPTYITNSGSEDFYQINDLISGLNIETVKLLKNYSDKSSTLSNLDDVDVSITKEIFQVETPKWYKLQDFMLAVDIEEDNCELVTFIDSKLVNKVVNKLSNFTISEILSLELEMKIDLYNKYKDAMFNTNIYEPLIVTNIDKNGIDEIIEYKWHIFDIVKTMTAGNMTELDMSIIDVCNHNEFIPYKDILEIINGQYKFLKYYEKEETQ